MILGIWNREKQDFIVEFDHFTPTELQTYIWRNAYINTGDCRETWPNKCGFSAGDNIQWLHHISLLGGALLCTKSSFCGNRDGIKQIIVWQW